MHQFRTVVTKWTYLTGPSRHLATGTFNMNQWYRNELCDKLQWLSLKIATDRLLSRWPQGDLKVTSAEATRWDPSFSLSREPLESSTSSRAFKLSYKQNLNKTSTKTPNKSSHNDITSKDFGIGTQPCYTTILVESFYSIRILWKSEILQDIFPGAPDELRSVEFSRERSASSSLKKASVTVKHASEQMSHRMIFYLICWMFFSTSPGDHNIS